MEYHSQSLFCRRGKGPICHIDIGKGPYPITVTISQDITNRFQPPYIGIHLTSLDDLVAFKNSVIGAHEKAMREAENA